MITQQAVFTTVVKLKLFCGFLRRGFLRFNKKESRQLSEIKMNWQFGSAFRFLSLPSKDVWRLNNQGLRKGSIYNAE